MTKIRKTIIQEIERLERANNLANKVSTKLEQYFIKLGIPQDTLTENFNNLKSGDISTNDFVKSIQKAMKDSNQKEKEDK